jgi:hypothetical protein
VSQEIPGIEYVTVEPVDAPVPLPNRVGKGGLKFIEGPTKIPKFWLETVYFQRRMREDNGPPELRVVKGKDKSTKTKTLPNTKPLEKKREPAESQ